MSHGRGPGGGREGPPGPGHLQSLRPLHRPFQAIESGGPGFGRWGKKIAHGQPLRKIFTSEEEVLDVVEQAILEA